MAFEVGDGPGDGGGEVDAGPGRGDRADVGAEGNVGAKAGGQFGERGGDAVVGVGGDDDPGGAGLVAGDAEREVVGLAAGAGKHGIGGGGEVVRGDEPLGVVDDPVGEVPGVGVEGRELPGHGLGDVGVGVADAGDVVIGVQVGVAFRVVQVHARAADEGHGLVVEQPVGAAEHALAPADELLGGRRQARGPRRVEAVDHQRRRLGHWCTSHSAGRSAGSPQRAGDLIRGE